MEFAIISPLFLFLLLGIVACGIYISAAHGMQQLVADAARTAIAGLDANERKTLATSFVNANATKYAFVDATKLHLDIGDNPADTKQFVVKIKYDAADLPIWALLPRLPVPVQTITRTSTIRIGGV